MWANEGSLLFPSLSIAWLPLLGNNQPQGSLTQQQCWEHPPRLEGRKLASVVPEAGIRLEQLCSEFGPPWGFWLSNGKAVQTKLEVILQGPSKSSFACVTFLWRGWFWIKLPGPDYKLSLLVRIWIASAGSQSLPVSLSLLWPKSLTNWV